MKFLKSLSFDAMAITASVITGLVCLYLLFINPIQFDPFEKIEQEKIIAGKVKTRSNRLVRKSSGEFSWSEMTENQIVYFNDRLFTNQESGANIKLNEGDEILMGPNTLIEVAKKLDAQEISFFKGKARVKVASGSTSKLKIGEKEYTLKGSDSTLEITGGKGKAATIDLVKGNASLISKSGETIDVREGGRVEIKKEKVEVKKDFLKTSLISPFTSEVFEFDEKKEITFEWKTFGPKADLIFELSKNKNFTNVIHQKKNPKSPYVLNVKTKGKNYWRIREVNQKKATYSSFNLQKVLPVNLIRPANYENVTLLYEKEKLNLNFRWNKNKFRHYEFELRDDDNDYIVQRKVSKENVLVSLEEGKYSWRIISYGQKIKGPASNWNYFNIVKEKNPFSELPRLKIVNRVIDRNIFSRTITVDSPTSDVLFEWKRPEIQKKESVIYEITLKDSDDKVIDILKTKENFYKKTSWKKENSYKLSALPILGKFKGEVSKEYDFTIRHADAPLPPIISKEYILNKVREEDLNDPQKVNKIFWTKLLSDHTYRVQISQDDDFDDPIKDAKTMTPSFTWPINKEGIFYFRVATIDGWGKVGKFSEEGQVKINPPLPTLEELAAMERAKRLAKQEAIKKKKAEEKLALLEMLKQKQKMATDAIAETVKKGVKRVLSWMEFIPKSVLLSLGSSIYEYEQKSSTVNAKASAIMANFGGRVNFDVLDTYVGQINYMIKSTATTTGQDFTDMGLAMVAGKHVRLSDKLDFKPTAGLRVANLTFFKLNGNDIESFHEYFLSLNSTLMLSYQQSVTTMHDLGVYLDLGGLSQFGAEYQFTYKPKGSKWLFDLSTLFLTGEATASDDVNDKTVSKNELQFSFQLGREFK